MAADRPGCVEQDHLGGESGDERLDPAAVLAHVGGNPRLLQELAKMFLEDCPQWMAEIRGTIDRGDASGLRYCAHQLRGSVGTFGTPAAYERARELEALAHAGDLTRAADVYSTLEEAIGRFQQALAPFAQAPAPGVPPVRLAVSRSERCTERERASRKNTSAEKDARRQTSP